MWCDWLYFQSHAYEYCMMSCINTDEETICTAAEWMPGGMLIGFDWLCLWLFKKCAVFNLVKYR